MLARWLLAFALGGTGVPEQAIPAAAPTAAVRIDVVVTDARGQRVNSLTAADFSVTENGRRLPVESVVFSAAAGTSPGSRLFAILLDDFHITSGDSAERLRDSLTRFIRDDLAPGDRFVVLRPLDSLIDITLTEDRAAAMAAIAGFSPRRGDYSPRSEFERTYIAGEPARVESARARIVTSALRALVTALGRASDARKTLIVVSEGFNETAQRRGEDVAPPLRSVAMAANRVNVSIYALAPATPAPDSDDANRMREALHSLSAETGGLSFDAPADARTALRDVQADAAGYYALSFVPSDEDGESDMEPLSVGVSRAGLSVRTHTTFSRPRRPVAAPPAPPSFLSPFSTQMVRRTSALIRPWFGMSAGADGKTRVSFVWEPATRVTGDRRASLPPAKIALTVTTLDGQLVYSGVVQATTPERASADATRVSFETPPGRLLVQMAIQDIASRVVDRDVRDIVVGGFPGPVALGTAEFFRTRTARERDQLIADPDAAPVASRQFSRSERLVVRIPIAAADDVVVSAQLVSAFGSVMRAITATPLAARSQVYQLDLPLASFAAGAYSLEITARTSAGSASDRIAFRITP